MAKKSKKVKVSGVYVAALKKKLPLFAREEERDFGGFIKTKYWVIVTEEERYGARYHPRLYSWPMQ